jgi:hypothetical protein
MTEAVLAASREIFQSMKSLASGFRRRAIAACAATALVLIYGVGFIGSQALSVIGISTIALTTTAKPAEAGDKKRHRGDRGRRRKRGRHRRRRRRGNIWEWYYVPYWYYW